MQAWGDRERGVTSAVSQVRLLGVWVFLVQFGVKAWAGWRRGALAAVFDPQIGADVRVAKKEQIADWDRALAQAARSFGHSEKQYVD
jgi:hypothetical protein